MNMEEIKKIDGDYGIVVERAIAHHVVEHDDLLTHMDEREELIVEFSYKINDRIKKIALNLWLFKKLYMDAKGAGVDIRLGDNYTYVPESSETMSPDNILNKEKREKRGMEFNIIEYIERLIKEERKQTGPMFG